MKKIIYLCTLFVFLIGCASKGDNITIEEMQNPKVEEIAMLINDIGIVEISDEELIDLIERKYELLSEDEKNLVTNYDVLIKAKAELEELINNCPLPFNRCLWGDSTAEIIESEKSKPDKDYYEDGYRVLQYSSYKYMNQNGIMRYYFKDDALCKVYYDWDFFDIKLYEQVVDSYIEKYGECNFSNENGYVWKTENVDLSIIYVHSDYYGIGYIDITFLAPQN